MSKIRLLIVEDELLVAQELAMSLTSLGYQIMDTVSSSIDAKRALEVYKIDVVLIDIKLKGSENGISLAMFIYRQYSLPVIYTTSLYDKETIDHAALTHPSAYLIKPYNYKQMQIAIEMAFFNFENKKVASFDENRELSATHYMVNEQIFIKDNGKFVRIQYKDIYWLKAESSYVSIRTDKKEFLLTSDTLGSFLEKVKIPNILRTHRSYAVNIDKVRAFEGNQLYIEETAVPIGKNYRNSVRQHFHIL